MSKPALTLTLRLDVDGAPPGSAVVAALVLTSTPSPLDQPIFDTLVRVAKPGKKFRTPLSAGCTQRKDGLFSRIVFLITRPNKIVVADPSTEAMFVAALELALCKYNVQRGSVAVTIFVRPFDYQSRTTRTRHRSVRSNLPRGGKMLAWERELLLPIVVESLPSVLEASCEET